MRIGFPPGITFPSHRLPALLVCALFILPLEAQQPAAADDLPKLQGRWEYLPNNGVPDARGATRAIREVGGAAETVTYYDAAGNVLSSHRADFELRDAGPVRLFVYFNGRVLAGAGAGRVQPGRSAYVYRLNGDEFYEVHGLTSNTPEGTPPRVILWKRLKPAAPAP